MKRVLAFLAISTAMPFAVNAQQAAPAMATATPAAGTAINGDTTIETAMAAPAGKAAMQKVFPEIPNHAAYEQFKGMSLRQLEPLAGGIITDEKIAAFEAAAKTK